MDLSDVVKAVDKDDQGKFDLVAQAKKLFYDPVTGRLELTDTDFEASLSDWAETQLFSRLGMPSRYFKGLRSMFEHKLVAPHVNHHIGSLKDEGWLLRARESSKGGKILRGILTERYTKFDNRQLLEILTTALEDFTKKLEITDFDLTESSFHLRMIAPYITAEAGKVEDKDDVLSVGIHIANSEVGRRAVTVMPLVYRQVCSNGLIAWVAGEGLMHRKHLWIKEEEMTEMVASSVAKALQIGADTVVNLLKSKENAVSEPLDIIKRIGKQYLLSKNVVEGIMGSWEVEPEATMYGVINAITRAAKEMPMDERVGLEMIAGKLIKVA